LPRKTHKKFLSDLSNLKSQISNSQFQTAYASCHFVSFVSSCLRHAAVFLRSRRYSIKSRFDALAAARAAAFASAASVTGASAVPPSPAGHFAPLSSTAPTFTATSSAIQHLL